MKNLFYVSFLAAQFLLIDAVIPAFADVKISKNVAQYKPVDTNNIFLLSYLQPCRSTPKNGKPCKPRRGGDIVTVPNGKPNIITPRGNILQGQNLLFQWDKIEGVKKYILYIQNDGNQEIWKTEITDNKYNFTDKDFPLKRSIPYKLIIVTDSNNGYKEASAKFIILNEAKATKIKAEIDHEQDLIKKVGVYQNYDLYSEPIELLEKQKTKSYDIYVNLADCYYLLGRIDKAKENYEYALQLPTNTAEQKELLQKEIQKLQELIDKNKKNL